MEEKSALRVRNARGHAQGITAIHSPLKSMTRYWISGMILDGLESLETLISMITMKWKLIGLIGFHSSIEITGLCIMEKSPMSCLLIDHLTMPLISRWEKNPLGDLSMLSQKNTYQHSRNILRKCLTRERFAQASHQQVHLSSSFQNHMAKAYAYVWTIEDTIESP